MSFEKLKEVALKQFAIYGYEGASLAMIADEVGIKKQSIYSHYKNKEDLFLQTYQDAVERELNYIDSFFEDRKSDTLESLLETFIQEYLDRYREDENTSFFMRTSFFPPLKLEALVKDGTNKFVSSQEDLFKRIFQAHSSSLRTGVDSVAASLCFLTLMDGLFVEMLYGEEERLQRRTQAARSLFGQMMFRDSAET